MPLRRHPKHIWYLICCLSLILTCTVFQLHKSGHFSLAEFKKHVQKFHSDFLKGAEVESATQLQELLSRHAEWIRETGATGLFGTAESLRVLSGASFGGKDQGYVVKGSSLKCLSCGSPNWTESAEHISCVNCGSQYGIDDGVLRLW